MACSVRKRRSNSVRGLSLLGRAKRSSRCCPFVYPFRWWTHKKSWGLLNVARNMAMIAHALLISVVALFPVGFDCCLARRGYSELGLASAS